MPHHPFQALQILRKMRAPRIGQDQPPYALGIEIQGYAEHGTQAKFLLGLLRKTGQFGKMLAVVTIPAKSGAEAVALIPANAGFGIVKEKDLSFGERQVFRCEALGIAGSYGPDKYALEFAIAESEDPFFAIEDAGQFAEQLAEGFDHAFFGLHQGREADEGIMLGSVQAVAVTDERQADAACKCASHKCNPRKDFHPPEAALQGSPEEHGQGHSAGQQNRTVQAPTNSSRQGHKEIDEPEGGGRVGEQKKNGQGRQVCDKRKVPFVQARKRFHQKEQERRP